MQPQYHCRKILLTLFVIFLANLGAFSQKRVSVELIKGSIIEGEMISYIYGDTLHLLINGQYPLSIPESGIKSISFAKAKKQDLFKDKQWLNTTRLSLNFGSTAKSPGISHTLSRRILKNQNLFAGLGIGIDNYYTSELYNVMPIFGSIKYYFIPGNISPFIDLRGGYGIPLANKNTDQNTANGGRHFNPIIGYRFGGSGIMIEITGGLKFQKLDYQFTSASEIVDYDILIKRAEVGLNIQF